jgi:hypothetical protein
MTVPGPARGADAVGQVLVVLQAALVRGRQALDRVVHAVPVRHAPHLRAVLPALLLGRRPRCWPQLGHVRRRRGWVRHEHAVVRPVCMRGQQRVFVQFCKHTGTTSTPPSLPGCSACRAATSGSAAAAEVVSLASMHCSGPSCLAPAASSLPTASMATAHHRHETAITTEHRCREEGTESSHKSSLKLGAFASR